MSSTVVYGRHLDHGEDATGIMVPPRALLAELRNHQVRGDSEREFFELFGFRAEYDAQEVLCWLGY